MATSEAAKKRSNRWYHADPERGRTNYLKSRYKVTAEKYDALLAAQHGICDLCKQPMDEKPGSSPSSPVFDHDHKTGKFRGFIHRRCNTGIGALLDNPVTCRLAAEYLERKRNV